MTPGSPEAISAGCTCPIMDNNRGVGRPDHRSTPDGEVRVFWVSGNCPQHAPKPTRYSSTTIDSSGDRQPAQKEEKGYT